MISQLILSLVLNIQENPNNWEHTFTHNSEGTLTTPICKAEHYTNDKAQLYMSKSKWKRAYGVATYNEGKETSVVLLRMPVDGYWQYIDLTNEGQNYVIDNIFTCEPQQDLKSMTF